MRRLAAAPWPQRLAAAASAVPGRRRVPQWQRVGRRTRSNAAANVCWRRRSLRNATAWCRMHRRRRRPARRGRDARFPDCQLGQRGRRDRRRRCLGLHLLVRDHLRRHTQRRHPAARRHRPRRRRPCAGAGTPARQWRWCRAWAWRGRGWRAAAPNGGARAASPLPGPEGGCARLRGDAEGVGATRARPRG